MANHGGAQGLGLFEANKELLELLQDNDKGCMKFLPQQQQIFWKSLAAAAGAYDKKISDKMGAEESADIFARFNTILEAAVCGKEVHIDSVDKLDSNDSENKKILINGMVPQILAAMPIPDENEFEESSEWIFGVENGYLDGSRCTNRDTVSVSGTLSVKVLDDTSQGLSSGVLEGFGCTCADDLGDGAMSECAQEHVTWQHKRIHALRSRVLRHAKNMFSNKNESSESSSAVGDGQVIVVGRICSEGAQRLRFTSAMLCSCSGSGFGGNTLELINLQETLRKQLHNHTPQNCLTPIAYTGMIVAATGTLIQDSFGSRLRLSSLSSGIPLPSPKFHPSIPKPIAPLCLSRSEKTSITADAGNSVDVAGCFKKQNAHVMVCSATFLHPHKNGGWRLKRGEMCGVLKSVVERRPHAAVFVGPLVCWMNLEQQQQQGASLLSLPDFMWAYCEFIDMVIEYTQNLSTKIYILPSTRDAIHPEPLPQPPYVCPFSNFNIYNTNLVNKKKPKNLFIVSNPFTLHINDINILFTSADPITEIGIDLVAAEAEAHTLIKHTCMSLLQQRHIYPRGTSTRTPLSALQMPHVLFDDVNTPHIFAFPSAALRLFTQAVMSAQNNQEGSKNIQSLNLTSNIKKNIYGSASGSFACTADRRIFLGIYDPQETPHDGIFSWINLYIHPKIVKSVDEKSQNNNYDLSVDTSERVSITKTIKKNKRRAKDI